MRLLLESTLALDSQFNVGHLDGVIARRTSVVGRAWCGCWALKCKIEATRILEFLVGNFWSGANLCGGSKPQSHQPLPATFVTVECATVAAFDALASAKKMDRAPFIYISGLLTNQAACSHVNTPRDLSLSHALRPDDKRRDFQPHIQPLQPPHTAIVVWQTVKMSPSGEVTLPATRRTRRSIGGQSPAKKTSEKENATIDMGSTLAANRKKSRSKSIGPGGLDGLKPSAGNRRVVSPLYP